MLKSVGSWYDVLANDGAIYKARLRGKFKLSDKKLTNPIAVGDTVELLPEQPLPNAIIIQIHHRKNYIIRKAVHKSEHSHIIAANIDEAFLVVTLRMPRTSLGFIDRFLVAAECFRIPVSIIFNKYDLYSPDEIKEIDTLISVYEPLGYKCFKTSVTQGFGVEILHQHLSGKKILFSGHSGVGKSSLLNVLFPHLNLKTGGISNFAQKGVHTTTFAQMFPLPSNTFLIDTPGIKEFGLAEVEPQELSHYFPEMRSLLGECKFNSCLHVNEPDCKVIEALQNGEIALTRYENYISMLENKDNRK